MSKDLLRQVLNPQAINCEETPADVHSEIIFLGSFGMTVYFPHGPGSETVVFLHFPGGEFEILILIHYTDLPRDL